ncbi:MAG: hypothetical protein JWO41_218 [Candidatus Saccharibacteria bacterium]|nr:hypothetical protein [Candidatus Saccharibacteria bacterium]
MADVARFEHNLQTSGQVIDLEGIHSEFVSGMHGQKVDFDKLGDQDELYGDWVDVNADYIEEQFPRLPEYILGVANGTNRVVHSVARRMNGRVVALESRKDKDNDKVLYLPPNVEKIITLTRPALVAVVEDVGTTGSNSVQVAVAAKEAGAGEVIVVTTWKRRPQLERLEEAGIEYMAIIDHPLPTFTPEDCETQPDGFCARDWEFKPRKK